MAADGSYVPANVSREIWVDMEIEVEQSTQSYLACLDEYVHYYNNEHPAATLGYKSSVQYKTELGF